MNPDQILEFFTGTTAPIQEVMVRSQVDGQLQKLAVEVGDRIEKGQILGQQDDGVLTGTVNTARAEREAQVVDVAKARSQVGAAKANVEQARLALVQAQGNVLQLQNAAQANIESARLEAQQNRQDADRLTQLAKAGATSQQEVEQARTLAQRTQQTLVNTQANSVQEITQAQTAVKTAEQALQAAIAQVDIEQGTVNATQRRVYAQQSVLNQALEQRSFTVLTAPLTGVVMERFSEAGNLLQTGDSILRLGDFKQIKITVQVPARLLSQLRQGQQAKIALDAFPQQKWSGKITRISPLANTTSRLLPIEIVMDNPGKVSSGLLARVSFVQPRQNRVWVPEAALKTSQSRRGPSSKPKRPSANRASAHQRPQPSDRNQAPTPNSATLFVLDKAHPQPRVTARPVRLGAQRNGQVEILQGLTPGESFVSRSSQPLKDGATVRLSAISESSSSVNP
ncbi:efflux RND transporter periplasmic adaptor subunit [Acaryochloris sp. CCMEE 5410]|uniref:efflux RND transporter periplasmic adaptor subunit n=1 Tax=Acaryochloris sp. CCMEE 5410 TaxID=310037 RepID=UPI000248400D|nr:efflux RND transporter periplasmic adaptor subunit [Acaryochloris sp. CCMEE 5410]KAI9132791.1 efflux RND transporter periplasmic adaptor subunit [Acaryochloris sp. CCMEE 5410]